MKRYEYKKVYVLPIASAVIMGGIAYLTYFLANSAVYLVCYLLKASLVASDMDVFDFMYTNYFVNLGCTLLAAFVGAFVYFAVLIRSGGATEAEIRRLPKGATIASMLKKLHILR